MEHHTTPRKTVPNQSPQHLHDRKALPDAKHAEPSPPSSNISAPSHGGESGGETLLGCLLMLIPSAAALFMMYSTYEDGQPWGSVLLSGGFTFIIVLVGLVFVIFGSDGSPSSSDRVVQALPARTKAIMDANPDMTGMEAAQHIVPPPGDPRSARVSTVRMPDGRVVVVACDPRGGPPAGQPAPTNPQQLLKGDRRHG